MPAQVKRSPRKRMPKMTAVTKTLPSETPEISYERVRPKTYATDEKRAQALELFRHGIGYTKASRILDMSPNTLRDWHRASSKAPSRRTSPTISIATPSLYANAP